MIFSKAPKTFKEQLEILKSRGLAVKDEPFALHCLKHLNYYRLSAYRFPFTVRGNPDQFLPDTQFNDIWNLYHFDRTLRRLVLDAAKRVEISVRTQWAYLLGHKYGTLAYENAHLFDRHFSLISKVDEELKRSQEDFIGHYKEKYGMTHPPIWVVCEVMSFGQVSHFYKALKHRADRQAIAGEYGLDERILKSFLHHLTVVRNHAAHHGRIWNRKFAVKFQLPRRPKHLAENFTAQPDADKKIYNTLVMLLYLLKIIEPQSRLPGQLRKRLDDLDLSFPPQMGFPKDWQNRSIWAGIQKGGEA